MSEKLNWPEGCYSSFINLDHRQDRLAHMHGQLDRIQLQAERTRGIYPHELEPTPGYNKMLERTPGAAGCHHAQVSIMKKALELRKSAFIMEDDLIFCKDFRKRMDYIENFLDNQEEWDIMWLGGTVHLNPPMWHTGINQDLQGIEVLGFDAEPTNDKHIIRTYGAFCTYAYIVNISSLKRIIKLLEDNVHRSMGIDWLFIYLQPQLRTFMFLPGCIKQMDNQSDIGKGHTIFSGFSKLGEYWYKEYGNELDLNEVWKRTI